MRRENSWCDRLTPAFNNKRRWDYRKSSRSGRDVRISNMPGTKKQNATRNEPTAVSSAGLSASRILPGFEALYRMAICWPLDQLAAQTWASNLYGDGGESSSDFAVSPATGYETVQWKKYDLEELPTEPFILVDPDESWRNSPLSTVASDLVHRV